MGISMLGPLISTLIVFVKYSKYLIIKGDIIQSIINYAGTCVYAIIAEPIMPLLVVIIISFGMFIIVVVLDFASTCQMNKNIKMIGCSMWVVMILSVGFIWLIEYCIDYAFELAG